MAVLKESVLSVRLILSWCKRPIFRAGSVASLRLWFSLDPYHIFGVTNGSNDKRQLHRAMGPLKILSKNSFNATESAI